MILINLFFAEVLPDEGTKIWIQKKRVDKNLNHAIWFDHESKVYSIGPKKYIANPKEIMPPFLKTSSTITCPHGVKIWSFWNGEEWVEPPRVELQSYLIGM